MERGKCARRSCGDSARRSARLSDHRRRGKRLPGRENRSRRGDWNVLRGWVFRRGAQLFRSGPIGRRGDSAGRPRRPCRCANPFFHFDRIFLRANSAFHRERRASRPASALLCHIHARPRAGMDMAEKSRGGARSPALAVKSRIRAEKNPVEVKEWVRAAARPAGTTGRISAAANRTGAKELSTAAKDPSAENVPIAAARTILPPGEALPAPPMVGKARASTSGIPAASTSAFPALHREPGRPSIRLRVEAPARSTDNHR